MLLLSVPFEPSRRAPASLAATECLFAVAAGLTLTTAALAVDITHSLPSGLGRAAAGAAVHATFFALGWILATDGARGWRCPALAVAAALLVASIAGRLSPWGALTYALVPALVVFLARNRIEFRRMGFMWPAGLRPLAAGVGMGAFLGIHLLLSSSLTFGYAVRVASAAGYVTAIAYDLGASALTAEWLFRGALFSRWWRRWRLWPAAGLATTLAVVRYLLDPALPSATEARAGAVFYTALLGLGCCALRSWSGSLLPGYVATVTFFVAYRFLAA
jgi:Type II CAAX prenyl endopeptidase Rce1-like